MGIPQKARTEETDSQILVEHTLLSTAVKNTVCSMADESKMSEQIRYVEDEPHFVQAVPDFVKVEGGVLLDAGAKNEHQLKVAKDGHVSDDVPLRIIVNAQSASAQFDHKLTMTSDCPPATAIRQPRRPFTLVLI